LKSVRDTVHGFAERPHYEGRELDNMFEKIVVDFLRQKRGKISFPIDTDDLKSLIERDVSDLDQYADLSKFGPGVEGLTEFPRAGKPKVLVSADAHKIENRLRTTLTHEYGHVRLHGYLFASSDRRLGVGPSQKANAIYCKRDTIISAGKSDWMEWQAGYACGAILMPRGFVEREVKSLCAVGSPGSVSSGSPVASMLISKIAQVFSVSRDASRVRLRVLGYLN
jgi:hypothetical protein